MYPKHLLVTGVAICRGDEIASDVEVTEVEFRNTSEEALARYAELGCVLKNSIWPQVAFGLT
ncbi:Maf family protein [Acetomicrobium sp. S15 = DSM 107314]|uniref:Maf family protein n=1 Tax=Acetomicrobium sp. S15 = DSM 107314 TaxID=2529858 RepID=UPI001E2E1DDC|nr:Maf family protein [Acetomicrobium sp. S15 = DSM 107314]